MANHLIVILHIYDCPPEGSLWDSPTQAWLLAEEHRVWDEPSPYLNTKKIKKIYRWFETEYNMVGQTAPAVRITKSVLKQNNSKLVDQDSWFDRLVPPWTVVQRFGCWTGSQRFSHYSLRWPYTLRDSPVRPIAFLVEGLVCGTPTRGKCLPALSGSNNAAPKNLGQQFRYFVNEIWYSRHVGPEDKYISKTTLHCQVAIFENVLGFQTVKSNVMEFLENNLPEYLWLIGHMLSVLKFEHIFPQSKLP